MIKTETLGQTKKNLEAAFAGEFREQADEAPQGAYGENQESTRRVVRDRVRAFRRRRRAGEHIEPVLVARSRRSDAVAADIS